MSKMKTVLGIVVLVFGLALAAGCGSNEKPAPAPAPPAAQTGGHDSHGQMPKEDPMPMMKDMDQQLQDLLKQVKGGQMMEAQKTTGMLVGTTDKVMLHMSDAALKDKLRQTAVDIQTTVNAGKLDPNVMEGKIKTMQDLLKQTTAHLQTMKH